MRFFFAQCLLLLSTGCFIDALGEAPDEGGHGADPSTGGGGAISASGGGGASGGDTGGAPSTGGQGGGGGVGGGECGNGVVESAEACDDGANAELYDGCNPDCTFAPYDVCDDASPVDLPAGKTIHLASNSDAAADDMVLSIPGMSCSSDGPDLFFAVRVKDAGPLVVTLEVDAAGSWGSHLEQGVLIVRTGCAVDDPGEVLVCNETVSDEGIVTTQLFAQDGQVVYVGVDGRGNGQHGPFDLRIEHFKCGDSVVQPPEQCDGGVMCNGCLSLDPAARCGGDTADTRAFYIASEEHCYVHATTPMITFYDAREACIEMGGDLASLSTNTEKTSFDAQELLLAPAWVGIEDFADDGAYEWLAGGAFSGPWVGAMEADGKAHCAWMVQDGIDNAADDAACEGKTGGFICELRGSNP